MSEPVKVLPSPEEEATLSAIPRLRWDEKEHRFHYNMPVATEPGRNGFVLMQQFDHADSFGTWLLPNNERHQLEEMEKINHMIHDVENSVHLQDTLQFMEKKRAHHDEFHHHESDVTQEEEAILKKKEFARMKRSPKKCFEAKKYKPPRVGRVHQPRH